MGDGLILAAVAAVLIFWAVGAWNRLVALRNTVADAWAQVNASLARRDEVAEPLLQNLRQLLAGETTAIDAMQNAHARSVQAAATMTQKPLQPSHAQEWLAAEAALAASAARVFALLEGSGEPARQPPLPQLVASWNEAAQQAGFARQLFNREAAAYDDARALFPTSLLARIYGFGPAGRV